MIVHDDGQARFYLGDCRHVMRGLDADSFDAIVTDPPYDLTNRTVDVKGCEACGRTLGGRDGNPFECPRCGGPLSYQRSAQGRGFMGKAWDGTGVAFDVDTWLEALRVAKPGAHLVAFGGTRTHHRLMVAMEDAGWEIRDCLMWLFGSGFPKSLDVSKAIDKAAGAEREVVGTRLDGTSNTNGELGAYNFRGRDIAHGSNRMSREIDVTAPATDLARQWEGWGTALKPAYEPIVLARKPLRGTVAQNVAQYGTGGINIDGCRIGTADDLNGGAYSEGRMGRAMAPGGASRNAQPGEYTQPSGRWPANVILDEDAAALLDETVGERRSAGDYPSVAGRIRRSTTFAPQQGQLYGDSGGPSRFFYTAKASRAEREKGLDGLGPVRRSDGREKDIENPRLRTNSRKNHHPTVKPLDLMRWLCRLVTPPGGVILDPFLGSGTTAVAAKAEGFRCVGVEMEREYVEIARRRCAQMGLILTEAVS